MKKLIPGVCILAFMGAAGLPQSGHGAVERQGTKGATYFVQLVEQKRYSALYDDRRQAHVRAWCLGTNDHRLAVSGL